MFILQFITETQTELSYYELVIKREFFEASIITMIEECGPHVCEDLALLLLKKKKTINNLKKENKNILREAFDAWLSLEDADDTAEPRTWKALAECMSNTDKLSRQIPQYIRQHYC